MKRRTRLRKLGLPADPTKGTPSASRTLLDLSVELKQALTAQTLLSPSNIHALATDWNVIQDARTFGLQQTVTCLKHYGMTPSELRSRFP